METVKSFSFSPDLKKLLDPLECLQNLLFSLNGNNTLEIKDKIDKSQFLVQPHGIYCFCRTLMIIYTIRPKLRDDLTKILKLFYLDWNQQKQKEFKQIFKEIYNLLATKALSILVYQCSINDIFTKPDAFSIIKDKKIAFSLFAHKINEKEKNVLASIIKKDDISMFRAIYDLNQINVYTEIIHLTDKEIVPEIQSQLNVIQYCVLNGSINCFKYLLTKNIKLPIKDDELLMMQTLACISGSLEIFLHFTSKMVDISKIMIISASYHQSLIYDYLFENFLSEIVFLDKKEFLYQCIKYENIKGIRQYYRNDHNTLMSILTYGLIELVCNRNCDEYANDFIVSFKGGQYTTIGNISDTTLNFIIQNSQIEFPPEIYIRMARKCLIKSVCSLHQHQQMILNEDKDKTFSKLLPIACQFGSAEFVESIININDHKILENCPKDLFIDLINNHNIKFIQLLIDVIPYDITSAFNHACQQGDLDIVKVLYSNDRFKNEMIFNSGEALINAIKNQYKDVVQFLLENGFDPNKTAILSGRTYLPLLIACERGYYDIVKLLLEHPKIDVNQAIV